jgi:tetratricopeptide (TPR) repeat protein
MSPRTNPENKPSGNYPWRTFSIFISSTFADMQAERDYLKQIVFPRVEEELQKRHIKLEIVDLRWGIATTSIEQEDEREASVLKVCLDEIKRCRPFFIGLLGDRYGWVPPEERMKNAVVGETLVLPLKGKSVTALEIEFGVLAGKEQLSRSVFYFREPIPYEKLSPDRAAMFSDAYNPELSDSEKQGRKLALENLKTSICGHFENKKSPEKVKTYHGNWDEAREKVTGLETWGEIVYKDILAECKSHAEATWDKVPRNWKEQELALLDAFIERHTAIFCGRNKLLTEIKEHLLSREKENWGMVLTGESGSGKSSVFAMVKKTMDHEDCFVLAHSAGLSPRAKNVIDLLLGWNTQLSKYLGIQEEAGEKVDEFKRLELSPEGRVLEETAISEIEKIQERFRELLFTLAEKQQVVLLVDALDRFEPTDRARFMTWLPTVMPGNIRMLCTAITHTEEKAIQYHNSLFVKSLDYFSKQEAKDMLDALCQQQHKTLPGKVTTTILEKLRADGQPATSSPLWLSLAVNMMMVLDHDDFEKISQLEGRGDQQIESYMASMALDFDPSPGSLFLTLVTKAGQIFGKNFTKAVLNYLACSRNGLRESDLGRLIPESEEENWDALQFANLRRWFNTHLREEGEGLKWNLAHSILRNSLLEEIELQSLKNLHHALASYIADLPTDDELKISETMYHLIQAGNARKGLDYYIGKLTEEETAGATKVLTEALPIGKIGIHWTGAMIEAASIDDEKTWALAKLFIYDLHDALAVEGNLESRLQTLEPLIKQLKRTNLKYINDEYHGYHYAGLNDKLGAIHYKMGHMDDALNYFDDGVKLFRELCNSHPKSESLKYGQAISYERLGSIHQAMGQMEEALKFYEIYSSIGKEFFESNRQNDFLKNNLANSYNRLGSIHLTMGHMEVALRYYEDSLKLIKEPYKSNSLNDDRKFTLASTYGNLGEINQAIDNNGAALKYFEKYTALVKELYDSNPRSELLNKTLAISYGHLGDIHRLLGHLEEAHKYLEEFSSLFKALHESNSTSEEIKFYLARSYGNLGEANLEIGNNEVALIYFEKYSSLSNEIYISNPHSASMKQGLAASYFKLGEVHQEMGHIEEALKYYEKYSLIVESSIESTSQTIANKNGLAISYERLGSIHMTKGNLEVALKYFYDSLKQTKELIESDPQNVSLLEGLGISYYRLAMVYKLKGNNQSGKDNFMKWKTIISHLTRTLPQVPKYAELDRIEYD